MEIWKDIKGFEGLYQISDLGRVKSLSREIVHVHSVRQTKERILKKNDGGHGYLQVDLYKTGSEKTHKVARLVAEHFIPNPENKRTVNHKKGIKTDNRAKELEWMTQAENVQHAYDVLGRKASKPLLGKFGKQHHSSKAIIQLIKSGGLVAEYGGQCEAGRKTGIFQANISAALLGKYKTAGGFIWKFKEAS